MKRIHFILFNTVFILSWLSPRAQNAGNFNITSIRQATFDDIIFPGKCPKQITVQKDEGTILCDYLNDNLETEVIKTGADVCGAWGAWAYGECVGIFRSKYHVRNCSRTDVLQDKHVCNYVPNMAWIGWVGTATSTHLHGGRYNKTYNWPNEEIETEMCFFSSLSPELSNALATVTSGNKIPVTYSGEKVVLMKGSSLVMTEDWRIVWDNKPPPQVSGMTLTLDGRDIGPGQKIAMNNAGEHTLTINMNTRSGGVVNLNVPISVVIPVTIESITQKPVNNGATQFDITIANNDKLRSNAAWLSTSGLNKPGYVAEITGPKQYDLKAGSNALVSIVFRPSGILHISPDKPEVPASFDLVLNSPGANGLVIHKKTIIAKPVATNTPGGSPGTNEPPALRTISVKTISGEVIDVRVPNIIRPGDHVSGSVAARTSSTLEGMVIEIDGKQTSLKNKMFKFLVPAAVASIPFILRNNTGAELARTTIPSNLPNIPSPANPGITISPQQIAMPPQPSPGNFAPMNFCQPGQPLAIPGKFDGNAENTSVSINNIPCEVLAESDRGCFVNVPNDLPAGETSITIQEGTATQTTAIQVVTTDLSANKTVMQKGTRAKVTATVKGLENLDLNNNNFTIELINGSPAVVQFKDINTTTISRNINSSNTRGGTFSFTSEITGITSGSYTISSNLTSSTCTDCWKQYQDCIAKVEADEKKCYENCDKTNGGLSCYLACSAAARIQEAECFTAYLGCVRKKLGY